MMRKKQSQTLKIIVRRRRRDEGFAVTLKLGNRALVTHIIPNGSELRLDQPLPVVVNGLTFTVPVVHVKDNGDRL